MKATIFVVFCMVMFSLCAAKITQSQDASSISTIAPPPKSYTSSPTPTAKPAACAGSAKVIVPLYMAPGNAWDEVAAGARLVETIAIIKPVSGFGAALDSNYATYMQKLHDAGVVMVGHVDTNYGNRDISLVKADIDTYATEYPLLSGIYLDRAAARSAKLSYYETLYNYILSMPGWTHDILAPGILPDSRFLSVSTLIVSLDDFGTSIASASVPSGFTCSVRNHYAAMIHNVNARVMQTTVDALLKKSYLGYIYLSNDSGSHLNLSPYYTNMISYLSTRNANK